MRFWAGQTLAEFGTRIGAVAVPVLAVDLMGATNRQVGLLSAASTAGFLLVGLPAGALVDRWFKRRTMILADVVRLVTTLVVPLLWCTGHLRMSHLYVVAATIGLATVFFDVAYQSYIPVLVPPGEIGRANSRLEATAQLATSGGPALGGLLMHVMTAPVVMLADTLAHAASLVTLAWTRDDERSSRAAPTGAPRRARLRGEIGEGLRYVRDQPVIRRLVVAMGLSNLFATTLSTLMPILVLRQIGVVPTMLIGGIGALLTIVPILGIRRLVRGLDVSGGLDT